jgi:hypothetical protein
LRIHDRKPEPPRPGRGAPIRMREMQTLSLGASMSRKDMKLKAFSLISIIAIPRENCQAKNEKHAGIVPENRAGINVINKSSIIIPASI